MGEQLKNLKCIKQRIISGFFRTINNEFHGFRFQLIIVPSKLPDIFYNNSAALSIYQYIKSWELISRESNNRSLGVRVEICLAEVYNKETAMRIIEKFRV